MRGKIVSVGFSFLALLTMACAPMRSANNDIQLIRASERGQTAEIYRLIKAGADVNAHDPEGWTPYLAASSMGHLEAMRILRAFGAKTDAPDLALENGYHPYSYDR